jgi:putative acetyltransferase
LKTASPVIRGEHPDDVHDIERVLRRAFENHPHSQQTEHLIVARLRRAGMLTLPHVAVVDGNVAGFSTFSQVSLSSGQDGWYGLGPVAVEPELQGRGIGRALIEQGLDQLQKLGAIGCVVLGEPAFYQRFEFIRSSGMTLEGVPPEYFLMRPFIAAAPVAEVSYNPAFFLTS